MTVNVGASTTLYCNVTRTNPDIANYTWMNEDTGIVLNSNTSTLLLMVSSTQDFGNISCTVTNAAGIAGKAKVAINQACKSWYFGFFFFVHSVTV